MNLYADGCRRAILLGWSLVEAVHGPLDVTGNTLIHLIIYQKKQKMQKMQNDAQKYKYHYVCIDKSLEKE